MSGMKVRSSVLITFGLAAILALAACEVREASPRDQPPTPARPSATQTALPTATRIPTTTPAPTPTLLPSPRPARSSTYLALGDSLAVGSGASDPATKGFVAIVNVAGLGNHGGALVHLGKGGETSGTFLSAQWPLAANAIAASDHIGLVTLTIGADDYLDLLARDPCPGAPRDVVCAQRALTAGVATYQQNYETILANLTTAVRAKTSDAVIVATTYYNPYDGAAAGGYTLLAWFELAIDYALYGADGKVDCTALDDRAKVGVNDVIVCRAPVHGVPVADVYPAFDGKSLTLTHILGGSHHPSDEGYRVIADAVISAVDSAPK